MNGWMDGKRESLLVQIERLVDVSVHQWGQVEDSTDVNQTLNQLNVGFIPGP